MRKTADTSVHYALKNWGAVQRSAMAEVGIPPQHAKGASWVDQITGGESWLDLDAPPAPDEDDAERTQRGMVRCMAGNMEAAMILTKSYRDHWDVDSEVLKRSRQKFWNYL